MKTVKLYWSNICILHKYEKNYLENLILSLREKNINLEVTYFGIGYPYKLNEYLKKTDAILPDIMVSTDLEVYEDNNIYSKFSKDLYNLSKYFDIKNEIKSSSIYFDDRLLPFLVIPLVFSYNSNYTGVTDSIKNLIDTDTKTAIGGINNSGAKSIVKAIWSKYGKDSVRRFLSNSTILDMPIQSFNDIKNGSNRVAITPSIYAKRANNKDLFMSYPNDGAIALPSYIAANKSLDEDTMLEVLNSLISEDFCNSFVKSASLLSCISNTIDDSLVKQNQYKFLYPSKEWLNTVTPEEFIELYNTYI
ncbi:ABC transporter substrate-binding protein [Clostridium cadaveris]|uniref:ABC transporter substrate-binding protein n=1 Tax=Clostridium cadaveris TaxID=1529 RepID=UPI0039A0AC50